MEIVRQWVVALCLLLSGALSVQAASGPQPHRLLLVLSDSTAPYQETRESFERSLRMLAGPAIPYDLEVIVPDANGILAAIPSGIAPDLVIPVGVDATRAVHEQLPDLPVFSILITREAHDRIHDQGNATALFLEQPFSRQFRFIRLTLPAVATVSVLVGPRSRHLVPELQDAARRSEFELQVVDIDSTRNIVDAFELALDRGEVIFALPDADVLSPGHARWLLHMAWQREIPVFGFSQAIVDAGAFAGLYTTPAQVGREAAEQVVNMTVERINHPQRQWRLPPPRYPAYFEVALNQAVARALAIRAGDRQQLVQSLRTIEQSDRWQAGQ